MSKTNLLMAAIGGLLLISGCQSYKDGKSRTVGEFTDDTAIQVRVKSRLVRAPDVNGALMNIEVKKGVVTLKGRVNSPRDEAESGGDCGIHQGSDRCGGPVASEGKGLRGLSGSLGQV